MKKTMGISGEKIVRTDTFDVINPYTKKKIRSVPIAQPGQIKEALRLSYEKKSKLTSKQRADVLRKMADILIKNKHDLAKLITDESGLCLKDTLHEIDRARDVALFSSMVAEGIDKDTTHNYLLGPQQGRPKLKVITEPLDLVVAITPFNHPLNQVAHKAFPAVAAGACMVLKPSEKSPLSAIKLAGLLLEAGLEENMLNIITGTPAERIVTQMVSEPYIDMVTFTGSRDVGFKIMKKTMDTGNGLKKYIFETGGCSPLIIHEDADIDRAVEVTRASCFKNSGQRCTSSRRVIVHEKIADEFVYKITETTNRIKYGDPYDPNTDMGTVISEQASMMIEKRVNDAILDGAELKIGNIREGALYSPTVLDKVDITSELVVEETFGPVCPIIRAKDIDDAIRLANQTNYRLAGAVITKSLEIAKKVCDSLTVGQFNWNGMPNYRTEGAPFGGFGDSGNGEKEGAIMAAQGMRRIRTFYTHQY